MSATPAIVSSTQYPTATMPNAQRPPTTKSLASERPLASSDAEHSINQDQERNRNILAGLREAAKWIETHSPNSNWHEILKSRNRVPHPPKRVAWYPSCGWADFHPLLYFKSQFLTHTGIQTAARYEEPDLWVFSDPYITPPNDFQKLYQDDDTHITLLQTQNLHPGPNAQLAPYAPQCQGAWLCTVEVESNRLGNYTAQVLFFKGDNIDLLTRLFIGEDRLPLTHLYWICDGWTTGMGNQRIEGPKGNFLFLKPLALSLGIKWCISEYVENNHGKKVIWPRELANYQPKDSLGRQFQRIGTVSRPVSAQSDVHFYEAVTSP